jgi:tetratricopeptide (TPR) repeat protein/transglutaminase-like putative cysteine protease
LGSGGFHRLSPCLRFRNRARANALHHRSRRQNRTHDRTRRLPRRVLRPRPPHPHLHLRADGTGSREITGTVEIRNQAGVKTFSVLPFDFASNSEHIEIDYVRVRHADGSVVTTPATDAQELPTEVTREAPFYSDLKQEQIPIRGLQPGDLIEYKLRFVRTKPEAPGHFWGNESFVLPSSGVVARSEVIELHVPKDIYTQVWSPNYKPTVSDATTNGTAERVYRWQSSQLAPAAGKKRNDLLKLDNNPTLGTSDDPPLPHVAWTNFHSWQEVGAWYRSLEGSRTQPNDDIRAKVATLTAGKSTPDEKARAIYGYVSAQVRYIGVAFGVGRFQPHEAGDVLNNQYGDCKDKSTLLISMLSAAGITADPVLIGAGVTFNADLPSPGSFNHVITLAQIDGKPIWLDSTPEVSPYLLLSPIIRGKRALVIPTTADAHIETTPKDPPFPLLNTFEAIGTLDSIGTSHSHIVMNFRGDDEAPVRQAVRSVSPAQWDELMQRFSQAMSYSGKVTNSQLSHPEDTSIPFNISYDYEREKNGDWDNLRIIAQVPPISLADIDEKDPPVTPIELGAPHTETAHAVMTLPKGWNADLPASIHIETPFAANSLAVDLVRQASQAEQRSDWDAAHRFLDQAKAINPNQTYLWSNYGYLAMQDGNLNDAIADYKKELAANPEEAYVTRLLASALMRQQKPEEAIAVMQSAMDHNPSDEPTVLLLASTLTGRGDNRSAEKVLRTGLAAKPDSLNLKMRLGIALLYNMKTTEGETLLRDVINSSSDPLQLNNAAYELANANLDLPLAETTSKHSLDLLDEASNNGETGPNALRCSRTLANAWDTYGWILYRDNKIAEAEPWIRAAWRNGNSAESGYHLAMILEKENHLREALNQVELAFSGERGTNAPAVQKLIDDETAKLIKSAGGPIDKIDSKMELQQNRTYKLSRGTLKPTGEGWATVELDVTPPGHHRLPHRQRRSKPPTLIRHCPASQPRSQPSPHQPRQTRPSRRAKLPHRTHLRARPGLHQRARQLTSPSGHYSPHPTHLTLHQRTASNHHTTESEPHPSWQRNRTTNPQNRTTNPSRARSSSTSSTKTSSVSSRPSSPTSTTRRSSKARPT